MDYETFDAEWTLGKIDDLLRKPDYSSPAKRRRFVDNCFSGLVEVLEKEENAKSWGPVNRRKKSLLSLMERDFTDIGLRDIRSVEESLTRFEVLCYTNYEYLDNDYNILLAAALWILDDLRWNGKLHDAYRYLPESVLDIDDVYIPIDFYHPCYEQELIQSVGHVINFRKSKDPEAFEGLIGCLDQDKVQAAVKRFKDLEWDALGRYLKMEEYFDRKESGILTEIRTLAYPTVLIAEPEDAEEKKYELAQKVLDLEDTRRELQIHFEDYTGTGQRKIMRIRDLGRIMDGFGVDDPYEACFVLVYLIMTDDDAAWLTKAGTAVVSAAGRMLPWYDFEEEWDDESLEFEGMTYNGNGWLDRAVPAEKVDYYHETAEGKNLAQRIYGLCRGIVPVGLHPFEAERVQMKAEGLEEADVVADWSEILFLSSFRAGAHNLMRKNWLWNEEEGSEELSVKTLPEVGEPVESERKTISSGGYWGKIVTAQGLKTTVSVDHEDVDKKVEELSRAKKEIKSLKKLLSELTRNAESKQLQYEHELKKLRQEHRELADLRELVFNSSTEIRETKERKQITYPYETRKRTVVFGGHDTFLKSIKPMLPSVKYVDVVNYGFSPEIVRNADVVWIQTNCISHSQYGNIVKITRQYGIQLRYFAYASAEKCAEQLVEEDRKE